MNPTVTTGEKPYQCEYCPYSACRRDMITRHMRTHAGQLAKSGLATCGSVGATVSSKQRTKAQQRTKRAGHLIEPDFTGGCQENNNLNHHCHHDSSSSSGGASNHI